MQSFLYLKVDIHIFTLNLKGMLLWYISEKRNMVYEDMTGNHFQVWPFNEEYSLVCYPQSWEVNSERWSYNTLGSFCVPWVGDDSGLKCSRRTSEQKEPPPDLVVVQPFTLSSLDQAESGACEPKAWVSWGWDVVRHRDVSHQCLSAFSPYPELIWCYRLSPTNYTVLVSVPLKYMTFSRLQY